MLCCFTQSGVSVRVPQRVTDMGTMEVMFDTGVGIRVQEFKGALAITVSLPPSYNVSTPWVSKCWIDTCH